MDEQIPNVPNSPPGDFVTAVPAAMPTPEQPAKPKRTKFYILAAVIILVIAGCWAAYTVYASPGRVWQKFVSSPRVPTIAQEDFSISYQDNGKVSDQGSAVNPIASMFSGVNLSLNGTSYFNNTDPANLQNSTNLSYTYANNGGSLGGKVNLILIGQDFYFNLGDNPLINSFLAGLAPGQKIDWLKINLKDVSALASGTPTTLDYNPDYNTELTAYKNIFSKYSGKVLLLGKLIDRPTLHGIATLHFSNTVDKTELKAMLTEMAAYAYNQTAKNGQMSTEQLQLAQNASSALIDSLIDKAQITTLETWIGASDGQLRRVKLTSTAPSLIAALNENSAMTVSPTADPATQIKTAIQNVAFDGVFNFDVEVYNFGQKQTVSAPDNAFDLGAKLKEMKQATQTAPPGMMATSSPQMYPNGAPASIEPTGATPNTFR